MFGMSSRFAIFFICLFVFSHWNSVEAQPRRLSRPTVPDVREIDQSEGLALINDFRRQGLAGDFVFRFDLTHLPHRAAASTLRGVMLGTWQQGWAQGRVELTQREGSIVLAHPLKLLYWNSGEPRAWISGEDPEIVSELDFSSWSQPLVEPFILTPFDIAMPFVFWDEFYYEGSTRLRGRPVHQFIFFPEEEFAIENPDIGAVRASLDTRFNALIQFEVLNPDDEVIRVVSVQNFRRVQEQWIVRTVEVTNRKNRDRARFEVFAAALGLQLPASVFMPEHLHERTPHIPGHSFESL